MAFVMPQPEWQPNLNAWLYPPWSFMKAPEWRQSEWSLIKKAARDRFWKTIQDIIAELPLTVRNRILDVQLVGSYAYGVAHIGSDFDLVMVMTAADWKAIAPQFLGANKVINFLPWYAKKQELMNALGCKLELMPGPSAEKLICYSFTQDKWFGKKAGDRIETRVTFDKTLGEYVFKAYVPHSAAYWEDVWA